METRSPRRWLVAHDFTPCADSAARVTVRDLLESGGGTLVLCHVFQVMPVPVAMDTGGAGMGLAALEQAASVDAARRLERLAGQLRTELQALHVEHPDAPVVEIEVAVRQAPAAEGIVAEAESRGVERIAVGTHGRRGLAHLLLGSVAEQVVRLARTPVLIVKEAQDGPWTG